jgi:hypothetical protein
LKVSEIPALAPDISKTLVRDTVARQGMLIEPLEIYVGQVAQRC